MMKSYLLLLLVLYFSPCISQNRANIWELSYSPNLLYYNCEMIFSNGTVDTQKVWRPMAFFLTNASICDTNGNMLFYTNGVTIGNRNYDTLQNAENFNPGYLTTFYGSDGMGIAQGALIIPFPESTEEYVVFYVSAEPIFANGIFDTNPLYLSYSIIDMNLDNGLGGIVADKKNLHAIEDTIVLGRLAACKHANGKDWWVITHEYYTDVYYKLLVTPDGIQGPFSQKIGSMLLWNDIFGESVFSPDGSKFAMMNVSNILDYMEFDRCNGEFFNAQSFKIPDSIGTYGCSFSPSNRFLYASSNYNLYQYDTWNPDMIDNVIHIAEWDSFTQSNIPVLFFIHQLAPDGKIYMSGYNGGQYFNVINEPDSLGLACNFTPHSFVIPQNHFDIPSFPNYDLGAMPEGDSCNSIYSSQPNLLTPRLTCRIMPNPVSDWLNIIYKTDENALFELFDINGRRVSAISLFNYFKNRLINVQNLPSGIYLGVVSRNGERIWNEKVVVQR